jgi:ATP-binding cassette subfamily C protein CydD
MKASRSAARRWARAQSREGRRQALPVILLGLCGCLAALFQAWCVARILADGLGGLLGSGQPPGALSALLGFAVAALLRAGLQAMAEILSARAGSRARARLRHDTMQCILSDGPRLLHSTHSGALTTLVVDRIEAVDGFFARYLPAATLAFAAPVLVLLAAALVQPFAAIVLLCCGIAVPVLQAAFGIGAAAAARRQFQALARLQTRFVDRMRGIATIVLAGRTEDEARRLAVAADELRVRTMRVLRVAFLSSAGLDCMMAASLLMIALHDGGLLMHAASVGIRPTLPVSHALFALLLVPEFFAPLRSFALAYQDRMQAAACADALAELPQPTMPPSSPAIPRQATAHGPGAVSLAFEDVHFAWDPARGPTLDGLSFYVAPGETVLLAGPSGSGKSTVIELLLGFIRPDRGRVMIDGVDLQTLSPGALSGLVAWIGQKPVLFAGSLRDNILFARPGADADALEQALRVASLDQVVAELPDGLETQIGEGGYGLSGGQAQRVAIARAVLRQAPLLLLDEPTAHLDPDTEHAILESLRRLARHRTVLMASHSAAGLGLVGRHLDIVGGRLAVALGVA